MAPSDTQKNLCHLRQAGLRACATSMEVNRLDSEQKTGRVANRQGQLLNQTLLVCRFQPPRPLKCVTTRPFPSSPKLSLTIVFVCPRAGANNDVFQAFQSPTLGFSWCLLVQPHPRTSGLIKFRRTCRTSRGVRNVRCGDAKTAAQASRPGAQTTIFGLNHGCNVFHRHFNEALFLEDTLS